MVSENRHGSHRESPGLPRRFLNFFFNFFKFFLISHPTMTVFEKNRRDSDLPRRCLGKTVVVGQKFFFLKFSRYHNGFS